MQRAGTVFAAMAALLCFASCGGDAELSCSLRPEGTGQADCYVTFLKPLKSGDTSDVRVTLDGPTLVEPLSFDYPFLAKLSGLDPAQAPPLNRRLRWRMPLQLVPELSPSIGDFIVHVTLYWGGKKQDMARMNTKSVFSPK